MMHNSPQNSDRGFLEFESRVLKKPPKINNGILKVEFGDLFAVGDEYALGHCVAEDMNMGSGIAATFRTRFKCVDQLLLQRAKQGQMAVLKDVKDSPWKYIYYLVTKKESNGTTTYETLWRSLCKLREHMLDYDVKKLALPKIGCGPEWNGMDRLEWDVVSQMLEQIFSGTNIEIVVRTFDQSDIDRKFQHLDLNTANEETKTTEEFVETQTDECLKTKTIDSPAGKSSNAKGRESSETKTSTPQRSETMKTTDITPDTNISKYDMMYNALHKTNQGFLEFEPRLDWIGDDSNNSWDNSGIKSRALKSHTTHRTDRFMSRTSTDQEYGQFENNSLFNTQRGESSGKHDNVSRNYDMMYDAPYKTDRGFLEFESRLKKTLPKINNGVLKVEFGNLFEVSEEYALGHCVAEDMNMGRGIAVAFRTRFKCVDQLLLQRAKQGQLAVLEDVKDSPWKYIYYLVTRRESIGKPTYETLWRSLCKMKEHMLENGVKKLAIPKIGCGLERLEWDEVSQMLEYIFNGTDIEIVVRTYDQNYGKTKRKLQQTKKASDNDKGSTKTKSKKGKGNKK